MLAAALDLHLIKVGSPVAKDMEEIFLLTTSVWLKYKG